LPTKNVQQNSALRYCTSQSRLPFWVLKPVSEHVHLLPRLPWSWIVLLPSDTHRKPIIPITAVLLPFLAYLLILPHIWIKLWDFAREGENIYSLCVRNILLLVKSNDFMIRSMNHCFMFTLKWCLRNIVRHQEQWKLSEFKFLVIFT
jgi:hypothetical protein